MFCTECGQQNSPQAKFCSGCGAGIKGLTAAVSADKTLDALRNKKSKQWKSNLNSKQKFIGISLTICLALLGAKIMSDSLANNRSSVTSSVVPGVSEPESNMVIDTPGYNENEVTENSSNDLADPGSFVWQRNLDMTRIGVWNERDRDKWVEDVGQQYLFVNKVGCLFYVFDENSPDKDLMQQAYQWLSQYAGVHIAGNVWILLDSSYDRKCTGPITDQFGGYQLN